MASLFTTMQKMQQKVAEGHALSDTALAVRRRTKKKMEHIIQATLTYEEDKIEVENAKELVDEFRKIRYLPEFVADKKKEEALFHAMQVIFQFKISPSSVSKYYYTKE